MLTSHTLFPKQQPSTETLPPLDFELPKLLECAKPTEERGLARDEVRLMVSYLDDQPTQHDQFFALDQYLKAGDALVVNTSGTLKSALNATLPTGEPVRIHFSTRRESGRWVIELRTVEGDRTERFYGGEIGMVLELEAGGSLKLMAPYYQVGDNHLQLWEAIAAIPTSMGAYFEAHGAPIRYNYVKEIYPPEYYQTVFAKEPGSAEMPSAGRAFTPELLARLEQKGVKIIPILLHTGVASLELDERPYAEFYRVLAATADAINAARAAGGRIIAVGTTVVRTLETVSDASGRVQAGTGWTETYITPERGIFAVDGLLTGFHEPKASHLLMLEALAGRSHLQKAYTAAIEAGYQWHEFGDLHLIHP